METRPYGGGEDEGAGHVERAIDNRPYIFRGKAATGRR